MVFDERERKNSPSIVLLWMVGARHRNTYIVGRIDYDGYTKTLSSVGIVRVTITHMVTGLLTN
jgi:hypothetical protein